MDASSQHLRPPSVAVDTSRRWAWILAGLAVVHVVARVVWPVLATDAFHDDYRQNWFWLGQVRAGVDYSATDPLTAYARGFQPPALAWLYESLARTADPYLFTKWIGLALLVPFTLSLWRLGEHTAPRTPFAPLLISAGLLDEAWVRELMGGLARSYGPPLSVALLAAVVAGRWWLGVAWLALAGLLHPQSLLLGASLFALGAARELRQPQSAARRAVLVPALAVVAVTVTLAAVNALHVRGLEVRFGSLLSRGEILAGVDYGPGGRFRNERPAPFVIEVARTIARHVGVPERALVRVPPFAPLAEQLPWALGGLAALGLAIEGMRRGAHARWRDVPWWIPACAGTAVAWNVAAYLFLPRLYFPRRFLVTYLPVALFGLSSWLVLIWTRRLAATPTARARLAPPALVTALAIASTARFGGTALAYEIPRGGYDGVARFLAAQPPATRYAANPRGDADTLIAMVPRRIEIASEVAHPLFRDYLEKTVRQRTRLVTRALFPEDPPRELQALAAEGVQLLVARRRDLSWEQLPPSFAYEPVRSEVAAYWSGDRHAAARGYWAAIAPRATVYEDEAFIVLDLRKLPTR